LASDTFSIKSKDRTFETAKTWLSSFLSNEIFTTNIFINITEVRSFPTKNGVTIMWTASDLATGRIYYDTKSGIVIASTTPSVPASNFANYANSKGTIRNLAASTTYYYKVFIQGTSDEKAISKEMSFVTE
jgi:hypothetical protein